MSRIVVTGAAGFLGHVLCEELGASHTVFAGFFRSAPESKLAAPVRLDITDEEMLRAAFGRITPDVVIHAAAIAPPDECERDPDTAYRVNVLGSSRVAKACTAAGCRLVHISTDLVFDGTRGHYTERDSVRGINVYARSKIEAESAVREFSPAAVILRVSVLYGWGPDSHPGHVRGMLNQWREGRRGYYFHDQFRTPTFAPQVARVVQALLPRPEVSGIYHVGGAERLSRLDFAKLVAELARVDPALVQPASMDDGPARAPRGRDCSLDSTHLLRTIGIAPVPCRRGLACLLESRLLKC